MNDTLYNILLRSRRALPYRKILLVSQGFPESIDDYSLTDDEILYMTRKRLGWLVGVACDFKH